jgi:exonuclease III
MVTSKSNNKCNLKIFSQNIRGLSNKIDELTIHWAEDASHLLCLTEHHLPYTAIQKVNTVNYNLGAYYCRQYTKCGGVCIFVQKSYQFTTIDLSVCCREQDVEVCALKMIRSPFNFIVVTIYRSPSGDFNIFLKKLKGVLNSLSKYSINLILAGDFNVNFMTDSIKRNHLTSLLETYNLEYIVTFPTRVTTRSGSAIDNIFLDRSKYNNFTIRPFYNGLSDHDALMLTLYTHSSKALKSTKTRIGRNYCMESIHNFKLNLSFESWESIFEPTNSNEVDIIFNNFLNVYLRIFNSSFSPT